MSSGGDPKRPWFGPKRVGRGLRPQTWQGWLVMAGFTVLAVAVAFLMG
jgi:hypothetical protein